MENMISQFIQKLCRKAAEFLKDMGKTAGLPVATSATPRAIGDVITAHNAAELALSDEARRANTRALLKVAEVVERHRHGLPRVDHLSGHSGNRGDRLAPDNYPVAVSLPLTGFDEQYVGEFIAISGEEFAVESPEWLAACAKAVDKVSQARAVFSPAALAAYREAGLNIPANIAGFRAAKSLDEPTVRSLPSAEERLDAAVDDLRVLETRDEDMYLVAAMAFYARLRRREIVAAHADWLSDTNGPTLKVCAGKSRPRVVPIPQWLYARLRGRKGHLISGATPRKRAEKCDATATWLRQHGSAGVCRPLAEYRSLFAGYIASKFSAAQAASILGHSRIGTALTHYKDRRPSASLLRLWSRSLTTRRRSADRKRRKRKGGRGR